MSTQAYYKERLGFDPADTVAEHHREQRSQHGYEESLSKFKDERDAIQKKTFTKWVNKHLKKASRHVGDLFEDLRDGHNLISLLEVLSGEHLPRERGRMRFHMLQNVQMALDFLRYKKIKLVNIRAEDIVDGNPKLTLGLIWTIILHFQVSGRPDLPEIITDYACHKLYTTAKYTLVGLEIAPKKTERFNRNVSTPGSPFRIAIIEGITIPIVRSCSGRSSSRSRFQTTKTFFRKSRAAIPIESFASEKPMLARGKRSARRIIAQECPTTLVFLAILVPIESESDGGSAKKE